MKKLLSIVLMLLSHAGASAVTLNFGEDGLAFMWGAEDKVGFLTASSTQMRFGISNVAEDGHCATFASTGWSLKEEVSYYAYAPYNSQYSVSESRATALYVDFSLQQQKGNDNTDHLSQHAFFVGNVKVDKQQKEATVRLQPMTSVLRLSRYFDAEVEIVQVQVSVDDYLIPLLGNMNLVEKNLVPLGHSRNVTLDLSEAQVGANSQAVAYLTVPACNLEGHDILVTFTDSKGNRYEQSFEGFEIKSGNTYCIGDEVETTQAQEYTPQTAGTAEYPVMVGCDMPIAGSYLPTGIMSLKADNKTDIVFDLAGRRCAKSNGGIKIINGKKIIMR